MRNFLPFLFSWAHALSPHDVPVRLSTSTLTITTIGSTRTSHLSQRDEPLLELLHRTSYFKQFLLTTSFDPSSEINSDVNLLWENDLKAIQFKSDEVVRVLDANTVKLKKIGLVSFAGVQTPSGYKDEFRFPDCMTKSPSSKAKQLLPQGTQVKVKLTQGENVAKPRALIVLKSNGKLVNAELVREGFARPITRGRDASEQLLPGFFNGLMVLQKSAESTGKGMFKICEQVERAADDQFEPMELTVETQYGADGGKQILRKREDLEKVPPLNPTPTSRARKLPRCVDFPTYEDADRWYELYFPFYGDVAKLDRDGDGIPCSGLPHTTNQDRYRMKKPYANANK